MSMYADNLQHFLREKEPYLLDLFSGSGTVSKVAKEFNFITYAVDIERKYNPDLVYDISKLPLNLIPGSDKIFIIWASVPCTFYSILNCKNHWDKLIYSHRQYYYVPKSIQARRSVVLLEKVLYIIRKINPVYFFIENPRGVLRHTPQIKALPFLNTVSYHDYGLDIYKPTDIFHNCPFLKFKKLTGCVGKTFPGSVTKMKNSFDRSVVPRQLIQSIIEQIKIYHKL